MYLVISWWRVCFLRSGMVIKTQAPVALRVCRSNSRKPLTSVLFPCVLLPAKPPLFFFFLVKNVSSATTTRPAPPSLWLSCCRLMRNHSKSRRRCLKLCQAPFLTLVSANICLFVQSEENLYKVRKYISGVMFRGKYFGRVPFTRHDFLLLQRLCTRARWFSSSSESWSNTSGNFAVQWR